MDLPLADAMTLVLADPMALGSLSLPLRENRGLVQAAVQGNGAALEFASPANQADLEVVIDAARQNQDAALEHCAPELLDNPLLTRTMLDMNRLASVGADAPIVTVQLMGRAMATWSFAWTVIYTRMSGETTEVLVHGAMVCHLAYVISLELEVDRIFLLMPGHHEPLSPVRVFDALHMFIRSELPPCVMISTRFPVIPGI